MTTIRFAKNLQNGDAVMVKRCFNRMMYVKCNNHIRLVGIYQAPLSQSYLVNGVAKTIELPARVVIHGLVSINSTTDAK